jgi:hypothetical protein
MSDVERVFDRFIDAFAADLLAIVQAHLDVEVERAMAIAERSNAKQTKAELREKRRAQRLAAKARAKARRQQAREEQRTARLAEKERIKAERLAERETRQAEHDRLKQQRLALKQELEAERRRLREATRKRPVRQLPLDFDGLRTPTRRRSEPAGPPALFVVKRKRDGQIEKLARRDESAVANGAAANGAAANGAAANGAAIPVPTPPAE